MGKNDDDVLVTFRRLRHRQTVWMDLWWCVLCGIIGGHSYLRYTIAVYNR